MRVFSSVKESLQAAAQAEILSELRSMTERQDPGLQRDSFLSLTNDGRDQFFLKSVHDFILWGKVYFEPFSLAKAEQLKIEQSEAALKFLQPLKLQVFFSEGDMTAVSFDGGPKAEYFRYSLIQSCAEKALLVERVSLFTEEKEAASPGLGLVVKPMGHSQKQPQLTRNELAELIDLSLDLKCS